MGCNCSKRRKFEHVAPDGKVTEVPTQAEAVALARKLGGTWRLKAA